MSITHAFSPQPWRVRVFGATVAEPRLYSILRPDGGYCPITVVSHWRIGGQAGSDVDELALSEPLIPGVRYNLELDDDGTIAVAYVAPLAPAPPALASQDDPEADAYGVDVAWLSGRLDQAGDLLRLRGRECFRADLARISVIAPRELFHRPDAGVGLPRFVNGPGDDQTIAVLKGRLRRQYDQDPRVTRTASVAHTTDSEGRLELTAQVIDAVTDEPATVSTPGAAT